MYVYGPEAISTYVTNDGILTLFAISAAFQFHFMVLAIDVIDRRGSSNEMYCQLHQRRLR